MYLFDAFYIIKSDIHKNSNLPSKLKIYIKRHITIKVEHILLKIS